LENPRNLKISWNSLKPQELNKLPGTSKTLLKSLDLPETPGTILKYMELPETTETP